MRRNPCIDAIVSELDAAGIPCKIKQGRKHVKIVWDGGRRFYFTSLTPSDWRAPIQARAGVRRMLRMDGRLA